MFIVTWNDGLSCEILPYKDDAIEVIKNLLGHGIDFSEIRVFKVEEEHFPVITIRGGK